MAMGGKTMSKRGLTRRNTLIGLAAAGAAPLALRAPALAQTKAEVDEVVLAPQFGLAYVPLHVMEQDKLVEKHLAKNGLPRTKVNWSRTTGGAAANEALLSGAVHISSGGVGPLLTIWDRTKGNFDVKGVGTFDRTALFLNTINPKVKTLRDFSDSDRIALPAVKISIQAVTLHMACEAEFGAGNHTRLDHLTVSMSHPDGTAAMLSGKSEITAHFTSPPFSFQQLEDPRVHRVVNSFDTMGGPTTFNSAYATSRFRSENPRTFKAVFDALVEAHAFIQKNRDDAIRIYIAAENSKLKPDFIAKMLASPYIEYSVAPQNTMKYAAFMNKVGSLKNRPASWKDYFFPEAHEQMGS
jgi:NitT/TauT family transport system substrate-binding protein